MPAKQPGRLEGMLESSEGRVLQNLARDTPGVVVEIGSYRGKSSAYLGRGIQQRESFVPPGGIGEHTLYCIDVWRRFADYYPHKTNSVFNDDSIYESWEGQTHAAGVRELIRPLEMSSEDAHRWWTSDQGPNSSIGVLFIDAAHDYAHARQDYDLWTPYVEAGGIVAFHDYGNPRWEDGVTQVVKETIGMEVTQYENFRIEGWLAWATKK